MEGFCCIVVVGIIVTIIVLIATSKGGNDRGTKISPPSLTQDELRRLQEEEERNKKKKQEQYEWNKQVEEGQREYEKKRQNQMELSKKFNSLAMSVDIQIGDCILMGYLSKYEEVYRNLKVIISKMQEIINQQTSAKARIASKKIVEDSIVKINAFVKFASRTSKIENYRCVLKERLFSVDIQQMFDAEHYGFINKNYWDQICHMNVQQADAIIQQFVGLVTYIDIDSEYSKRNLIWFNQHCMYQDADFEKSYTAEFGQFENVNFDTDLNKLFYALWVYAVSKPYSAQKFDAARKLIYSLKSSATLGSDAIPDYVIAKLYAIKQLGASDVLRDIVQTIVKELPYAHYLTTVASSLMWMNAYQEENEVLSYMLKSGMQMSEKAQERLHTLSTGGGKTPTTHQVKSKDEELFFDVSSLTWKDDDYESLFNDLAFKGVKMSYSLAVRDQDEGLSVPSGCSVPTLEDMLAKFNHSFNDEYGDVVSVKTVSCVAMSGNNKEQIDCVLVKSEVCQQMGILVHLTRVGKKLNIKLYTLFFPVIAKDTADQKQQALSLHNELSPSVKVWETSLKESILHALQELLNQPQNVNSNKKPNDDDPIF